VSPDDTLLIGIMYETNSDNNYICVFNSSNGSKKGCGAFVSPTCFAIKFSVDGTFAVTVGGDTGGGDEVSWKIFNITSFALTHQTTEYWDPVSNE